MPNPDRVRMIKRSISAYQSQSLRGSELVIVMNSARGTKNSCHELLSLINQINDPTIRVIDIQGERSLGELRNISVAAARSSIICQWDDDDIFHPDRLRDQHAFLELTNADANILSEILLYLEPIRSIFYTNWGRTPYGGFSGSLMCKKNAIPMYPESGKNSMLGEDSYVSEILLSQGRLKPLTGKAYLLAYVVHGNNSWSSEFFEMIKNTLSISKGLLDRKKIELVNQIELLNLGSAPINFKSSNGEAFTYIPKKK